MRAADHVLQVLLPGVAGRSRRGHRGEERVGRLLQGGRGARQQLVDALDGVGDVVIGLEEGDGHQVLALAPVVLRQFEGDDMDHRQPRDGAPGPRGRPDPGRTTAAPPGDAGPGQIDLDGLAGPDRQRVRGLSEPQVVRLHRVPRSSRSTATALNLREASDRPCPRPRPRPVPGRVPSGSSPATAQEVSKICVSDVCERGIAGHTDFRSEVLATFGAGAFRWGALRSL